MLSRSISAHIIMSEVGIPLTSTVLKKLWGPVKISNLKQPPKFSVHEGVTIYLMKLFR